MNQKTQLQESCLIFSRHLLASDVIWVGTTSYNRDVKERLSTSFSTRIGRKSS
jgi:hypothetical protein